MNYSKKTTSRRMREIQSKKAMKKKRMGVRLFKVFLIMCVLLMLLGAAAGLLLFKKIIDDTPQISAKDIEPSAFTTTLYADDGETVIDTFVTAGSNREFASIEEIPDHLENAFIAVEDSRFRTHKGIDPKGIVRAAVVGIKSGDFSQGASTITQQLIKNSVFPNFVQETTKEKVERKVQEWYLAVQIEKVVEKDDILESYLNTINLGQNTLGVQSASKRYFGKDVSELTLSEAVTIAGITKSPNGLNPISNPEKNAERRTKVLKDMLEQGFITQEEHDEALADDVYSRIQAHNATYTESQTANSYFVDEVAKQVAKDLVEELGYTEQEAYNLLYGGGLSIITTENVRMQQICEEELNDSSNYPSKVEWGVSGAISIIHEDGSQSHYDDNNLQKYVTDNYPKYGKYGKTFKDKETAESMVAEFIETLKTSENDEVVTNITYSAQPQASIVVMDQATGHVKAIVGGRGAKEESMSLNRATQSTRQPGSTFKVVSTYVPALDAFGDSLGTVIIDEAYSYADGTPVRDWWGSAYRGPMTIRKCIEQSANIPSVKKLTEMTPALGYQYLTENFAFTTLPTTDIVQSLALGGITNGVYNLEMTAAYAAIANAGVYTEPIFYTEIYDHDGNLLYENTPSTHVAMKETTAALITDAMVDVVDQGTGTRANFKGMQIAGKTGTTTGTTNLWFCGYTPYLTASIWTGYDDNQPMEKKFDANFHKTMWRDVMKRIHEGYEYKDFEMPVTLTTKKICAETGKIASTEFCTAMTEYYASGTAPTQSCPGHPEKEMEAYDQQLQELLNQGVSQEALDNIAN